MAEEKCAGVNWQNYVDVRFEAQAKELSLYRDDVSRRMETMNEVRSQLDRQAGTFATIKEVDLLTDAIKTRITELEKSRAASEAKIKADARFTAAVVSVIIGIIVYFLTRG